MATEALTTPRRRLDRTAIGGVLVREIINFSSYWRSTTFSSSTCFCSCSATCSIRVSSRLRMRSRISSASSGLVRKSYAPSFIALTAASTVP